MQRISRPKTIRSISPLQSILKHTRSALIGSALLSSLAGCSNLGLGLGSSSSGQEDEGDVGSEYPYPMEAIEPLMENGTWEGYCRTSIAIIDQETQRWARHPAESRPVETLEAALVPSFRHIGMMPSWGLDYGVNVTAVEGDEANTTYTIDVRPWNREMGLFPQRRENDNTIRVQVGVTKTLGSEAVTAYVSSAELINNRGVAAPSIDCYPVEYEAQFEAPNPTCRQIAQLRGYSTDPIDPNDEKEYAVYRYPNNLAYETIPLLPDELNLFMAPSDGWIGYRSPNLFGEYLLLGEDTAEGANVCLAKKPFTLDGMLLGIGSAKEGEFGTGEDVAEMEHAIGQVFHSENDPDAAWYDYWDNKHYIIFQYDETVGIGGNTWIHDNLVGRGCDMIPPPTNWAGAPAFDCTTTADVQVTGDFYDPLTNDEYSLHLTLYSGLLWKEWDGTLEPVYDQNTNIMTYRFNGYGYEDSNVALEEPVLSEAADPGCNIEVDDFATIE